MPSQTALERYGEIIRYHGLFRGSRRVLDQIFQVDLYDWSNNIDTKTIVTGEEFYAGLGPEDAPAAMHYQPAYTATVRRPLKFLAAHFPAVGASSTCLLDLGCGSGKVLHIGRSSMVHVTIIGIDLHQGLLTNAAHNLGLETGAAPAPYLSDTPKAKLLLGNVNDVDYAALLEPYDTVIVHNKNSFDRKTTESTFDKIQRASTGKPLFYLYNNPVFEHVFDPHLCVFQMTGWHKNWNAKVFRIAAVAG